MKRIAVWSAFLIYGIAFWMAQNEHEYASLLMVSGGLQCKRLTDFISGAISIVFSFKMTNSSLPCEFRMNLYDHLQATNLRSRWKFFCFFFLWDFNLRFDVSFCVLFTKWSIVQEETIVRNIKQAISSKSSLTFTYN